jgi:hypothetical protein
VLGCTFPSKSDLALCYRRRKNCIPRSAAASCPSPVRRLYLLLPPPRAEELGSPGFFLLRSPLLLLGGRDCRLPQPGPDANPFAGKEALPSSDRCTFCRQFCPEQSDPVGSAPVWDNVRAKWPTTPLCWTCPCLGFEGLHCSQRGDEYWLYILAFLASECSSVTSALWVTLVVVDYILAVHNHFDSPCLDLYLYCVCICTLNES